MRRGPRKWENNEITNTRAKVTRQNIYKMPLNSWNCLLQQSSATEKIYFFGYNRRLMTLNKKLCGNLSLIKSIYTRSEWEGARWRQNTFKNANPRDSIIRFCTLIAGRRKIPIILRHRKLVQGLQLFSFTKFKSPFTFVFIESNQTWS